MRFRGRAALFVTAGFLVATALRVAPILPRADREIPVWAKGGYDVPTQAFLLGWGWKALWRDPASVFDVPIFHPERRTLTYMDSMIGEVAAASTIIAATGSIAAGYNFLLAMATFLSAWFTYRLARSTGAERRGAFLAGLLFAFSTYTLSNADFLNQLQIEFIPLGLYFGIRFHEGGHTRHAIGLGATLAVQAYFGWYYTCMLVFALLLLAIYATLRRVPLVPRRGRVGLALLVPAVALLIAPVLVPMLEQRHAMPAFRRTLGQAALYSADLLDYVRASDRAIDPFRLGLPAGINALFPGIVMIALGALGVRTIRRSGQGVPGYFPFLAVSSFILSLGPLLHVAGQRYWIPLPYIAAYYLVPFLSVTRAPFRMAVLVFAAGAVLASLGYRALDRYLCSRAPMWRGPVFAATVAVALLSAWPAPYGFVRLPTAESLEPAYRWLKGQNPRGPLLELPTPATDGGETTTQGLRQYRVLLHGVPRLDGCSGFVSPRYREFRRDIQAFPDSAALSLAGATGARFVLIHYADYPPKEREHLRTRVGEETRLTLKAVFGSDAVYRLAGTP